VTGIALAAALSFGMLTLNARSALETERAERVDGERVLSILAEPGLTRQPFTAKGVAGSVSLAATGDGRAVIVAAGLPALPDGRVFAVWLMQGDVAVPAGVLPVSNGRAVLALDHDPRRFGEARVTVEDGPHLPQAPLSRPIFSLVLRA